MVVIKCLNMGLHCSLEIFVNREDLVPAYVKMHKHYSLFNAYICIYNQPIINCSLMRNM